MDDGAEVTRDAFFDGRLIVKQPARGHRSGTDAVLLAAAVPRDFAGLVYDVGAGAGVAGLGVACACPSARVRLIENDASSAGLAAENIIINQLGDRADVVVCDLLSREARQAALPEQARLIVTNPPFYEAQRVRMSPDAGRRGAHVLPADVGLVDWLLACLELLAQNGVLIIVHAPAALPDILRALETRAAGATLMAVHPRTGAPARRLLVRAVKGSRAPFAIAGPLILHEGETFTAEAERLHRGEASLSW